MSETLRVERGRLPADPAERHAALRNYFCDKDAAAILGPEGWDLTLAWPKDRERHVDLRIEAQLAQWGNIGLDGMALVRRRSGRVTSCLYDSWTLHSWSEWLAKAGHPLGAPITILHIDDHRDLGSPRLFVEGGGLTDLISGRPFDLRDPELVRAAIESGAIGMGSFLTPFLLAFPQADVRHLVQAPKHRGTSDFAIEAAEEHDQLLQPGRARPSVSLVPDTSGAGPGRYRATDSLADWLQDLGEGPILLHVDMDYFNNRYDGDGDWMDRKDRLDPSLGQVLARIDDVAAAMRSAGALDRIEDAVIAFSPGFFPAEFWAAAEDRLRKQVPELYA